MWAIFIHGVVMMQHSQEHVQACTTHKARVLSSLVHRLLHLKSPGTRLLLTKTEPKVKKRTKNHEIRQGCHINMIIISQIYTFCKQCYVTNANTISRVWINVHRFLALLKTKNAVFHHNWKCCCWENEDRYVVTAECDWEMSPHHSCRLYHM